MKELLFATENASKVSRFYEKLLKKRNYIEIIKRYKHSYKN